MMMKHNGKLEEI